jgi:hypothetical protein
MRIASSCRKYLSLDPGRGTALRLQPLQARVNSNQTNHHRKSL